MIVLAQYPKQSPKINNGEGDVGRKNLGKKKSLLEKLSHIRKFSCTSLRRDLYLSLSLTPSQTLLYTKETSNVPSNRALYEWDIDSYLNSKIENLIEHKL